jgi:NTE family protein
MASYLNAYLEQQAHPYIHLVDGGLSDNLGLRAVMDHIVINGGLWNTLQRFNLQGARHIVLITVDASALLPSQWEHSDATPSSFAILDAATTTPLANYNFETLEFLRSNLLAWRNELEQRSCAGKAGCSAPGVYLIELRLEEIADPALRKRLTSIPTDFSLAPDVVDELIAAAHQLLNQNTQYRNLLKTIEPASR